MCERRTTIVEVCVCVCVCVCACFVMTRTTGRRARRRAHSLPSVQQSSEEQTWLSKHDAASPPPVLLDPTSEETKAERKQSPAETDVVCECV